MARFLAVVLAALCASANALAPSGLAPCPGYENHPFKFIDGTISSPITFPGVVTFNYHSIRQIDLPTDLVMDFKLRKTAPYKYDVPCTEGQGSCVYEVCDPQYFTPNVCAQQNLVQVLRGLPSGFPYATSPVISAVQQCGCPLRAGEVNLRNIQYTLPDIGAGLAIVRGDYEGQALFYGKSNPNVVLGCVNMAFSIV